MYIVHISQLLQQKVNCRKKIWVGSSRKIVQVEIFPTILIPSTIHLYFSIGSHLNMFILVLGAENLYKCKIAQKKKIKM